MRNMMKNFKKLWLISLASYLQIEILDNLFKVSDPSTMARLTDVLISLTWAVITFSFAYRKQGTKWLLFILIMIPCRIFVLLNNLYEKFPNRVGTLTYNMGVLLIVGLSSWFWINCFLLRRSNKKQSKLKKEI